MAYCVCDDAGCAEEVLHMPKSFKKTKYADKDSFTETLQRLQWDAPQDTAIMQRPCWILKGKPNRDDGGAQQFSVLRTLECSGLLRTLPTRTIDAREDLAPQRWRILVTDVGSRGAVL